MSLRVSVPVKDHRSADERAKADERQQPWRCVGCNVPVVPGRDDPCKCYPKVDRRAP